MSPQSAQSETKCNMNQYSDCVSSLSNSQIAQAADVAFSHHKRLDLGYGNNYNDYHLSISNPLDNLTSTPGGGSSNHRHHLRKRKKTSEPERFLDQGVTGCMTDFVSGIFQDLSQAVENQPHLEDADNSATDYGSTSQLQNHEESTNSHAYDVGTSGDMNFVSDDESLLSRKKRKASGNSLSTFGGQTQSKANFGRNKKSYSCLRSISSSSGGNCFSASTALSTSADACTSCTEDISYRVSPVGRRVSVKSQGNHVINSTSSDATLDTDTINNLVDKVLIESLVFPCLPPTVSESSCSSNNLTQTSVQAAQVLETASHLNQLPNSCKTHIEGEHDSKDTYGWFVDMDLQEDRDRADVILAAQENVKAALGEDNDLSFKAFTAPKKTTELDEEVEWAKAADTVDDVLGDFF